MDHVRWGILGAAKFARQHMGPALHMAKRGTLSGLATSHKEKAAPFVEMVPGLSVFDSYEALLASDDIDAVYIPLPNHMHIAWTMKAIEAGKHVLVEKPMALSASAFDRVIAARDDSGLMVAEAYMVVHHPQWHKAKALLDEGALGDLVQIDSVFSYNNAAEPDNIRNTAETGGGAIPDIGVYTYGTARYLTGQEPEEILSAEMRWENGVDVWSHITARFPACHVSAINSMRMAPRQEVTVQGTEGWLKLTAPFNPNVFDMARLELHRAGEVTTFRWPGENHYVRQVEAFNAAVLDKAAYPCPLEFSRGTQAMIDAVFAKASPPPK